MVFFQYFREYLLAKKDWARSAAVGESEAKQHELGKRLTQLLKRFAGHLDYRNKPNNGMYNMRHSQQTCV